MDGHIGRHSRSGRRAGDAGSVRLIRRVAGLHVLHRLEAQLVGRRLGVAPRRLHEEPDVVAEVEAGEDRPGRPGLHPVENRHIARAGPPRAALELVDLVAGLAAEQFGQVPVVVRRPVDGQPRARVATGSVWFFFEMQTRTRAGWMLHCVQKPTRQPERRPSGATAVTIDHRGVELTGQVMECGLAIGCHLRVIPLTR